MWDVYLECCPIGWCQDPVQILYSDLWTHQPGSFVAKKYAQKIMSISILYIKQHNVKIVNLFYLFFWQYLEEIGPGKSRVIPSLINRPLLWSPPSPNCHQPLSGRSSGLVWHRSKITFKKHFNVPMSRARKESQIRSHQVQCLPQVTKHNWWFYIKWFYFLHKMRERGECFLEHILPIKCVLLTIVGASI